MKVKFYFKKEPYRRTRKCNHAKLGKKGEEL